jgi:hypothetical protein
LKVLALCEVAKVPDQDSTIEIPREGKRPLVVKGFLKDYGWTYLLTMEQACIVRFLFVGGDFLRDTARWPVPKVPALRDVLEFQANVSRN